MRKTTALLITLLSITGAAQAQVYKCMQNGRPVFSERPCGKDATEVRLRNTDVTDEQRQHAEASARRQRAVRNDIEYRESVDQLERERAAGLAQAERKAKEDKCARYLRQAENAKNEASTYRYHQGLIDDAKRRQKEANDRHFSECYTR